MHRVNHNMIVNIHRDLIYILRRLLINNLPESPGYKEQKTPGIREEQVYVRPNH